jgi:hypothetical protein
MRALPLLAVCFAALVCTGVRAQATSDYQKFYQVLAPLESIKSYSSLKAVQRVRSRLDGVEPNDIEITILTTPPQKVAIAPDGRMQFPISESLFKANPQVASNQPKGSLSLSSMLEYTLEPGALELSAQRVADMMQQTQRALEQLHDYAKDREPAGIEFVFAELGATVEVIDSQRERTLYAERGQIIVRIDEKEAPILRLSHTPLAARPYLEAHHSTE